MARKRERATLTAMSTHATPAASTRNLILHASMPSVLVVDADRRVRASLAALLELEGGVTVVGVAGDVTTALDLAAQHLPDVIVLDPQLPDVESGIALLALLRQRLPAARIVVCACADLPASSASLKGADAVLVKGVDAGEFVASVLGNNWRLLDGAPAVDPVPFARLPATRNPR